MVRNPAIDSIKGFLILLVIIGHIILGRLDENVIRYVIYSFHMPVFFFVGGYLLNVSKLKDLTFSSFCSKYWNRMLKQWVVALLIYTVLFSNVRITFNDIIRYVIWSIVSPYYHLWFVPCFLIIAFVVYFTEKHIHNQAVKYLSWILGGLFAFVICSVWENKPSTFRLENFIFFIFGVLCKNVKTIRGGWNVHFLYITILILLFVMYQYYPDLKTFKSFINLPLVLLLCIFCYLPIIKKQSFDINVFQYMGRNSLAIYLWHVLPIVFFKNVFETQLYYYLISFVALMSFLVVILFKCKKYDKIIAL